MLILGIAGGSGSGKSEIARRLGEHFGDSLCVICHDRYYRSRDTLSLEQRAHINYDHPDAFETELLCEHLDALSRGEHVRLPVYDYKRHTRSERTDLISPCRIVVVEGILIFESKELFSRFDIRIFVDTDADIRLLRRIRRDVSERGRSLESVLEQYERTVKPMHDSFVEPTKRMADVIIPEGAHNTVALDMLISEIQSKG